MRPARFVGRVGGLAVALGVGAAVSLGGPAAAWADDTGSGGSEGSASTGTASAAGETSESQDTSAGTETTDASAAASADPDAEAETEDTSTPTDDPTQAAESDTSASTGSSVRQALRGTVIATGGHASGKPERERTTIDDAVEALTVDTPPKPAVRATARGGSHRQRVADPAVTRVVEPERLATPQPAQSDTSPPRTVTDYADAAGIAKPPVPVVTTTPMPTRVTIVGQAASAAAPERAPTVSTLVWAALATAGLSPHATTNDPITPVDSPLGLALLAIGTRPRPGQSVDNEPTFTTLAAATATAAPPRFETKSPIPVGAHPSGVVISPDGRLFVANTGSRSVSVIDIATGQRIDANPSSSSTDITVGWAPSALALSPDNKRLYVANTGNGTVSVIDTATYARIDANPSALSMDIRVGSAPSALVFDADGRLYVANRGSRTVSVIDTTTNTLVDTNPNKAGIQSISVGSSPTALALSAGGRLYVANGGANTVSVVDTNNYSVTNTVAVGRRPSSLALGADGRLYVTNSGAGTVLVINTTTNTVIDANPNISGTNAISVGRAPSSVALSPDESFAYVANGNDTVSVIDTATYTVTGTVAIDTDVAGAHVIAVGPDGTVYVTDAADRTVRVLAVSQPDTENTAPVAGTPTVGNPDTATGAVTGALNFTDPDGDTLSYNVTQPASGTVNITSAGTYTFTPTQTARQQAAQTPGVDTATFTVNATDGQATATVTVTVPIAPLTTGSGVTTIDVALSGTPSGTMVNTDGTHAVVITSVTDVSGKTTRLAVVDLTLGTQLGTTLTLPGVQSGSVVTDDGTRALITTSVQDSAGLTTRMAVVNMTTGAQMGATTTLPGYSHTQLVANGTRALITARDTDVTRVAVIDTATGTQKGTTITIAGTGSVLALGDGTSALLTAAGAKSTRVVLIDTNTGTQTGPTTMLAGTFRSVQLSADGNHALLSGYTRDDNTGVYTTRVAVVNLVTGTQAGSTLTFTGEPSDALPVTSNATRALVTLNSYDGRTSTNTMRVRVIDTTTGGQVGNGLALTGFQSLGPALVKPDGSRAVVSTNHSTSATGTITSVSVINTATGNQVGTTLTFSGYGDMRMSGDGSRVVVATTGADGTTQVAVVNTATGSAVRSVLSGGLWHEPMFSADGTRVLVKTVVYNRITDSYSTRLTVFNTSTGRPVGLPVAVAGLASSADLTPDGTRAVISTTTVDIATATYTSRISVINTTTGRQIGKTVTLTSSQPTSVVLSADGSRALITTSTNGITSLTVLPIA